MKDFKPHKVNGYRREGTYRHYYFSEEDDAPLPVPSWFEDTPFMHGFNEPPYNPEDEEPMHGYGWSNVVPEKKTQEQIELARAYSHIPEGLRGIAKQQGLPMKLAHEYCKEPEPENEPMFYIDPVTGEAIPPKYHPIRKGSWCESKGWISHWRFEMPFDEHYPVQWEGFESNTHELRHMGWEIMLEYNRYTGRRKLCFRNFASGLMARVPFEFSMPYVQIDKLFAVRNYKLKQAKFTELLGGLTEDMIPDMLNYIRETYKNKVSDFVWNQKQKEAVDKVVELGRFIEQRRSEAA